MRISVRRMMVLVAVVAGCIWIARMVPRARHYRDQAEIQAHLEAVSRREEQRLRSERGRAFDGEGFEDWQAEQTAHHARLKALYHRLARHPWEAVPADLPSPYPWDRGRDRAVLEAALADLMDPRNPDNAITDRSKVGPGAEVVIGETTIEGVSDPRRADEGPPEGPTEEAWDDLRRRHSGGPVALSGLALGGTMKVRYADLDRLYDEAMNQGVPLSDLIRTRYPKACGAVWAALPGYSRDGRTAVARFSGGFGYHPIDWAYELQRTSAGWVVRHRSRHQGE